MAQSHLTATNSTEGTRLAVKISNQCRDMTRNEANDMIFFKLPLEESLEEPLEDSNTKIRRFSFGQSYKNISKTILMMGATGSGKTTMINAMINYILGVEWDDPFRFILVDEKVQKNSQAFSQTKGITAYDIHFREGFNIPYSLTIVDTPGFGDTGGTERDKEITAAIKQFFEHPNGIQEIDAVGFTVCSSDARLTDAQKYIFNSVLDIFGKDIKENIRFLATFDDGNQVLVLEAIKEAKLPYVADSNGSPPHHSFNNGALFVSSRTAKKILKFQWEEGMDSFKSFFTTFSNMPTKSLQLTKEVLKNRSTLTNKIECLEDNIEHQIMVMEGLRAAEERIKECEKLTDENKVFEFKVKEVKKNRALIGKDSAMNCSACERTCHYPCNPTVRDYWCSIFWTATWIGPKYHSSCNVCDCDRSFHKNKNYKWEWIQVEMTRTHFEIKKKYEDAVNKKLSAEELKNALQTETDTARNKILKDVTIISQCLKELKKNALYGKPITVSEYLQMRIEKEEKNGISGNKEKIKILVDLLNSQLVEAE